MASPLDPVTFPYPPVTRSERLLAEADRCVKCGLCLPHCPTYGLDRDEGESPRGRISLVQGLASGALAPTPRLWGHIDRCLGCRACEGACPSGVHYGQLLDETRALQAQRRGPLGMLPSKLGLGLMAELPAHPLTLRFLRTLQRYGLLAPTARLAPSRLSRLIRLLPKLPPQGHRHPVYPTQGLPRVRVGLFTGCVGRLADATALGAAIELLTALGVEVQVPTQQGCCGAMHLHAGHPAKARVFAKRNRDAFGGLGLDALLYVASGCGAQLASYTDLDDRGPLDPEPMDVCTFLDRFDWPDTTRMAPLHGSVAVHHPCTQRNLLGETEPAHRLLGRIPGLRIRELPGNERCCGAAGTYVMTQPHNADRLGRAKIEALAGLSPHWLATSNTGCFLHLGALVRDRGLNVEVVHPVQLLRRQLRLAAY
jgi:glycolate oxidase iron-sulfur subunit